MTRNEKYWAERAERRMDAYVLSAEEQARVVRRSYNQTRAYVQSEIEKILHHVGGEDTLAYEYRMKRLTALLQNTEKRIKELYGITVEDTTEFLKSIIPEAYYHTIFDIAKGTGIEPNFAAVNEKLINSIVKEPWSGKNYSKRIWSNMDKLETELRDVLTDAAMNGESIGKTSRKVAESFNTASYNAERLIRTETTYACNQAELASYEELDIDRYKFVATLDTRTSPICQKMDGRVFKTKDAKAGQNLPAMHPNCRSTTIPYFEDFEPEERAARDADGNPIKVPANMTYPEWYDKYVKPKEQNKGPKTPQQSPRGKDTPKKPEPEKTPNTTPTEVEIPQPDIKPDYTDTPIPKRPVEVPRPEATAPAIKPEKKPSNSTKPIDKTVENGIIEGEKKAKQGGSEMEESKFGKLIEFISNLGNKKVAQMQYVPSEETLNKYQTIGIRAVPNVQEGEFGIGDILPESYDWDFENDISTYYTTKETLGGSSALNVEIRDGETLEEAIERALKGAYEYEGKDVFLVGGDFVGTGDDINEVIIGDATVIGKIRIYNEGEPIEELSKLEVKISKPEKAIIPDIKENIEAISNKDLEKKVEQVSSKTKEELFKEFEAEMKAKYSGVPSWGLFSELSPEEKIKWKSLK